MSDTTETPQAERPAVNVIVVEDRSRKPIRGNLAYTLFVVAILLGAVVGLYQVMEQGKGATTVMQQQVYALWAIQAQIAILGIVMSFGIWAIIERLDR
jgi:hypothetical protein